MRRLSDLPKRELRRLSEYLDGELTTREADSLERRIKADPILKWALVEMRHTRKQIASLPQVSPPRNLTLTPEMVGQRVSHRAPLLSMATALVMIAFTVLVGTDFLMNSARGLGSTAAESIAVGDELADAAMVEEQAAAPAVEESESIHTEGAGKQAEEPASALPMASEEEAPVEEPAAEAPQMEMMEAPEVEAEEGGWIEEQDMNAAAGAETGGVDGEAPTTEEEGEPDSMRSVEPCSEDEIPVQPEEVPAVEQDKPAFLAPGLILRILEVVLGALAVFLIIQNLRRKKRI